MQGNLLGPLVEFNSAWNKDLEAIERIQISKQLECQRNMARIQLYGKFIAAQLERAGEWDLVFQYLNNNEVADVDKQVSHRMLTTL